MSDQAPFKALYIEDEQITRETVATLVGRRFPELELHLAADGAEGLELFQELRPDLVITDIKMPRLDGIEMARRIMAEVGSTPIIVTSAHSDIEYLIEAIEIGISRYVMKPIVKEKLFAAIEATVANVRLKREVRAKQAEILDLNRHLAARAQELEAANRDLEAFSYTVSHDLRTPLTNINGYCQVIMELFGEVLPDQCRDFIGVILQETLSMNELIRTLLDFSRLSRKELSRTGIDLSEMAQAAVSTLRMREPERAVELRIEPELRGEGDRELIRVVLDNLLGNAWKYTGKKELALVEFGRLAGEGEPVYFVRDNGAGFDMALADRLFGAFQRLHAERDFQGFGIGLATVQRIIQRHGGRVWAEGVEGSGATFYFTLGS